MKVYITPRIRVRMATSRPFMETSYIGYSDSTNADNTKDVLVKEEEQSDWGFHW